MAKDKSGAKTLSEDERETMAREIPLPPEELRDELDNSSDEANAKKTATPKPREVAELDYLEGAPETKIELAFPFKREGKEVRTVTVRPLSVQQTADIIQRVGVEAVDNFDFYAAMCGLPAPVVRALRGQDGERVTGACYGFLPQWRKGVA